ncbi:UNVERIFIED_ASMBLY: myristylated tegument protein [human gammaherpesvirus 4]|nr:myristylated tegument protein [human gammaherpesvirus 4]
MGALWSLCRRRVNSIGDVDGGIINLYNDYEEFNLETTKLIAVEEGRACGEANEGLEYDEDSENDELLFLPNKKPN